MLYFGRVKKLSGETEHDSYMWRPVSYNDPGKIGVKNNYDNGDCVKSISIKALVNLPFIKGYLGGG